MRCNDRNRPLDTPVGIVSRVFVPPAVPTPAPTVGPEWANHPQSVNRVPHEPAREVAVLAVPFRPGDPTAARQTCSRHGAVRRGAVRKPRTVWTTVPRHATLLA